MNMLCPHDQCTFITIRGMRYECTDIFNLQDHCSKRFYHPCCQNNNLCETGTKIKKWNEKGITSSILYLVCNHTYCNRKFTFKKSQQNHEKHPHFCKTKSLECDICDLNEKNKLLMDKEIEELESFKKNAIHQLTCNEEAFQKIQEETMNDNEDDIIPPIPLNNTIDNNSEFLPDPSVKTKVLSKNHKAIYKNNIEKPKDCLGKCGCYGLKKYQGYCDDCFYSNINNTKKEHLNESSIKKLKIIPNLRTRVIEPEYLPTTYDKNIKRSKDSYIITKPK